MRNIADLFNALAQSKFRNRQKLGPHDRDYLHNRSLEVVLEHADDFIRRRLADAEPKNDGRQTPMRGHPVFVAQHATATCCRGCLEKWHRIEKGRPLTEEEIAYVVSVIEHWLKTYKEPTNI